MGPCTRAGKLRSDRGRQRPARPAHGPPESKQMQQKSSKLIVIRPLLSTENSIRSAISLSTPKPRSSICLRFTSYLVEKDLPDGLDPPSSKRASTHLPPHPTAPSLTPAQKALGSRSFPATNMFTVSTATAARAAQRRLNEQISDQAPRTNLRSPRKPITNLPSWPPS